MDSHDSDGINPQKISEELQESVPHIGPNLKDLFAPAITRLLANVCLWHGTVQYLEASESRLKASFSVLVRHAAQHSQAIVISGSH